MIKFLYFRKMSFTEKQAVKDRIKKENWQIVNNHSTTVDLVMKNTLIIDVPKCIV